MARSIGTKRLPQQSEKAFMQQVIDLAHLQGFHTYHPHDSRRSAPGWPDVAIFGHGRFMLAEIKREKGYLSLDQRRVIGQLRAAGVDVYVWKPSQWLEIVAELTAHRNATPDPLLETGERQ
jgi:hypothetical protein